MAESAEPIGSSEPAAKVRRLPVPVSLPPYDDETGAVGHHGVGHRDVGHHGVGHHGAAPAEPARPALRLVDAAGEPTAVTPAVTPAIAPAVVSGRPDPRRWVAKRSQPALECLYGQRPVQQLTRWTDEAVYAALARRVGRRQARSAIRPRIRAVRVCQVSATVIEATSISQLGAQTQALAVRLEADGQRWVCTAFELVERPRAVSR